MDDLQAGKLYDLYRNGEHIGRARFEYNADHGCELFVGRGKLQSGEVAENVVFFEVDDWVEVEE